MTNNQSNGQQPFINPSSSSSSSSSSSIQLITSTQTILLIKHSNYLQLTTTQNKSNQNKIKWFFSSDSSSINHQNIHYQHILNCRLLNHQSQPPSLPTHRTIPSLQFQLTFLKTDHNENHSLKSFTWTGSLQSPSSISDDHPTELIQPWIDDLMAKSYPIFKDMPTTRSILIIINPASGSKKSLKIWSQIVQPILESSTAKYRVIFTTHAGHAAEIGKSMDLDQYHVVSCISGDGLIHEFLNGLGSRKLDFAQAMNKLALTSIPAGSGNAFSTNHIGPKQATNIHLATLNLLKGRPTRIDICSMTQLAGSTQDEVTELQTTRETPSIIRKLSFLSVSFGLMADLDVGTEPLRWMGPMRFVLGFIWGAIRHRLHRIRLDVQLVQDDKQEITNTYYDLRDSIRKKDAGSSGQVVKKMSGDDHHFPKGGEEEEEEAEESARSELFETSTGLPKLKYGDVSTKIESAELSSMPRNQQGESGIKKKKDDEWITIETEVSSLYAGILPFMATDLLQFPAKIPGRDGSIHLTLHRPTSICDTLSCLIGAESGQQFRNSGMKFYTVKAFRLTPIPRTKECMIAATTTDNPNTKDFNSGANCISKDQTTTSTNDLNKLKGANLPKQPSGKADCHIALDGESFAFRPLQYEIHERLLRTLSLVQPDHAPYFGSIGVPSRIL